MTLEEARPVDPQSIEPRRLIPSDVRLHRAQLAGALTDDEAEAVDRYIRHIVIRRVLAPEAAANEAARLAVRFNDYYLDFRKVRAPHDSFVQAMHCL
jgi:hypothetical protein